MARRRVVSSVDTSDPMANLVLGSLLVALLALFGLIALVTAEDGGVAAGDVAETETDGVVGVVPSPTPDPEPEVVPPPDADGEDVPVVPDAEPPSPDADAPVAPRGDAPAGEPGAATADPETATRVPAEPRAPVVPRRDDAGPAVTPTPGEPEIVPDTPGPDTAGSPAPADPDPADPTPGPVAPVDPGGPDRPVPSGIDDPNRRVALSVSNEPIDVHTIVADLDGDGFAERVWAGLITNWVHLRIDRYEGDDVWSQVTAARGAVSDDLVGLWVRDLTGDGRPEIYTRQWVGTSGESATLWSFRDDALHPMTASGGCWDGNNTYGLVGVLVDPGRIAAICEEEPLPPYLWSTAVYEWRDGRWTFQRQQGVYE